MAALIIGMLICLGLAVTVVVLVAVPARREGRGLLTQRGEEVVEAVRGGAGSVGESVRTRREHGSPDGSGQDALDHDAEGSVSREDAHDGAVRRSA